MAEKEKAAAVDPKYKGRELIRSADGSTKDILTVILSPDRGYSAEEAKKLADRFLQKEVKQ